MWLPLKQGTANNLQLSPALSHLADPFQVGTLWAAMRRCALHALCLLLGVFPLSAIATGQARFGTYIHGTASQTWSIGPDGVLTWAGQPYRPIGLAVQGNADAIRRAVSGGVQDLIVDVPRSSEAWKAPLDALRETGATYLLRINSAAPSPTGVMVEPAAYRVAGIREERKLNLDLPGATSALVVLASQRDGEIASTVRVDVHEGRLTHTVKPTNDFDHVALIYPVGPGHRFPDFWEGMDRHRDVLLSSLRSSNPGPGLRGIVNPLGSAVQLPGKAVGFVPTSTAFRMEFEALLQNRYRNLETAMRAWSMAGSELSAVNVEDGQRQPLGSFAELAKLVPLWNGTRGVPRLWNPDTNEIFVCDSRRSAIWTDIGDAVQAAAENRYSRLVRSIRSVVNVPVVQEWAGWSAPYEGLQPDLDGVGVVVPAADPGAGTWLAARAASSLRRWQSSGWLIATGLTLETMEALPSELERLASLGFRGMYLTDTAASVAPGIAAYVQSDGTTVFPAQLPRVAFFPENARNPAQVQMLPGGYLWLPTPWDGERLDFGSSLSGFRMRVGNQPVTVVWSEVEMRVRFRLAAPRLALARSLDGVTIASTTGRNHIEIPIGPTPVIIESGDEVPIPQPALEETVLRMEEMLEAAQARRLDAVEERQLFMQNYQGFDRNPGGAYSLMRALYYRASSRLNAYTWIEAESSRSHSFSETLAVPGATGGSVLSLRTPLTLASAHEAQYTIPVRTTTDQEVWISARIPREQRPFVKVAVGTQTFGISVEPVALYGDDFGWYKLGTTRLGGTSLPLRILVPANGPVDLAIDAILFSPEPFSPIGPYPPDTRVLRAKPGEVR